MMLSVTLLALCASAFGAGHEGHDEVLDIVNFSDKEIEEMQKNVNKLFLMAANSTDAAHANAGDTSENHKMLMMMMMLNQAKGWGPTVASSNCQGYADVTLLLDSSGSITREHFGTQLDFVGRLANNFRLRTNDRREGYQISVVSFSNNVKEEFPLNKFTGRIQMLQAIKSIDYQNGGTQTHKALKYALQNSFERDNGGRRDAVRIVIVVTDGKSANPSETAKWAKALKEAGILVLAVGVGNGIDRQELITIASGRQNIFTVDDFDALDTIRESVGSRTCAVTVNNGGIVPASADFDYAAYHRFVQEQKAFEAQREQELEILEGLEAFQKRDPAAEVVHEEKREEKIDYEAVIAKVSGEIEHYDKLTLAKMEMAHAYKFGVSCKMFAFCELTDDQKKDMRRLISHGDAICEPTEDECPDDAAPGNGTPLDGTLDPVQVANAIDDLEKEEQIKLFFGGMKDAVCKGLIAYLDQVKAWEVQYPNFSTLI